MKEIRDRFNILALENDISQFLVVFGVSEFDSDVPGLYIKVTETNFQTGKDETLPTLNPLAVLAYR